MKPELIIMDEPTTALDVVVQREILEQVIDLQDSLGFSVLFITHDLHLMAQLCHRIGVMLKGELVEVGDVGQVSRAPRHDYTQAPVAGDPAAAFGWSSSRGRCMNAVPDLARTSATLAEPVIALQSITRSFGDVHALRGISLGLRPAGLWRWSANPAAARPPARASSRAWTSRLRANFCSGDNASPR